MMILTNTLESIMEYLVDNCFIERYEVCTDYLNNEWISWIDYVYVEGLFFYTLTEVKDFICNFDNYDIETLSKKDIEMLNILKAYENQNKIRNYVGYSLKSSQQKKDTIKRKEIKI